MKPKKLRIPRKGKNFAQKISDKKKLKPRTKESIKTRYFQKKKTYILILGLVILVPFCLFLLWLGFKIAKSYVIPIPETIGYFEAVTEWTDTSQISILAVDVTDLGKKSTTIDNLYYITLNTQNEILKVLSVPTNIYVDVAYGKGFYRLDKVYALGAIMEQRENMTLLKETFEKNFAVPVDRYIIVGEEFPQFLDKSIGFETSDINKESSFQDAVVTLLSQNRHLFQGIRGFLNALELKELSFGEVESNLSSREFIRLVRSLGLMSIEKAEGHEIGEDLLFVQEIEGNEETLLDTIKLDFFIQNNYYDYYVRQEHLKTKIFNGTSTPLVATKAARLVKNLGAEVIEVGNEDETDHSILKIAKEEAETETVRRLARFFDAEIEYIDVPEVERANIQLIIGKDWVEKMEGREEL